MIRYFPNHIGLQASTEFRAICRPKIRPKNGFFCYVPFLGLIFWVTFCSNSNTLTFDTKVYIWNNVCGEKNIVIVSPLPLVGAHTNICPKY